MRESSEVSILSIRRRRNLSQSWFRLSFCCLSLVRNVNSDFCQECGQSDATCNINVNKRRKYNIERAGLNTGSAVETIWWRKKLIEHKNKAIIIA